MKLQINERGSWRDVLTTSDANTEAVGAAVAQLAKASGCMRWRIVDAPDGTNEVLWAMLDDGTWRFRPFHRSAA